MTEASLPSLAAWSSRGPPCNPNPASPDCGFTPCLNTTGKDSLSVGRVQEISWLVNTLLGRLAEIKVDEELPAFLRLASLFSWFLRIGVGCRTGAN